MTNRNKNISVTKLRHTLISSFMVLVFVVLAIFSSIIPISAYENFTNGIYVTIKSVKTDESGGYITAKDSRGNVETEPQDTSNLAQYWQLVDCGGNIYKIRNARYPSQQLDVALEAGASVANMTNVRIYDAADDNDQKWGFTKRADGYYVITSQAYTGYNLNVAGSGNLQLYVPVSNIPERFEVTTVAFDALPAEDLGSSFYARVRNERDGSTAYLTMNDDEDSLSFKSLVEHANNQVWKFTKLDNGYYTIESMASVGEYCDVRNAGTADGTSVHLYAANTASQQHWKIHKADDGYILTPGHATDKTMAHAADGGAKIWTKAGTAAQRMYIEKLTSETLPTVATKITAVEHGDRGSFIARIYNDNEELQEDKNGDKIPNSEPGKRYVQAQSETEAKDVANIVGVSTDTADKNDLGLYWRFTYNSSNSTYTIESLKYPGYYITAQVNDMRPNGSSAADILDWNERKLVLRKKVDEENNTNGYQTWRFYKRNVAKENNYWQAALYNAETTQEFDMSPGGAMQIWDCVDEPGVTQGAGDPRRFVFEKISYWDTPILDTIPDGFCAKLVNQRNSNNVSTTQYITFDASKELTSAEAVDGHNDYAIGQTTELKDDSLDQIFQFDKYEESDGTISYYIVNLSAIRGLNVLNAGDTDGSEVTFNGTRGSDLDIETNRRWYIRYHQDGGYVLSPVHAEVKALKMVLNVDASTGTVNCKLRDDGSAHSAHNFYFDEVTELPTCNFDGENDFWASIQTTNYKDLYMTYDTETKDLHCVDDNGKKESPEQMFRFEKQQGKGVYAIKDCYSGKYFTVSGSLGDGVKVTASEPTGSNSTIGENQKWYLYKRGKYWRLCPVIGSQYALDLHMDNEPHNAQIWTINNNPIQILEIIKHEHINPSGTNDKYDKYVYKNNATSVAPNADITHWYQCSYCNYEDFNLSCTSTTIGDDFYAEISSTGAFYSGSKGENGINSGNRYALTAPTQVGAHATATAGNWTTHAGETKYAWRFVKHDGGYYTISCLIGKQEQEYVLYNEGDSLTSTNQICALAYDAEKTNNRWYIVKVDGETDKYTIRPYGGTYYVLDLSDNNPSKVMLYPDSRAHGINTDDQLYSITKHEMQDATCKEKTRCACGFEYGSIDLGNCEHIHLTVGDSSGLIAGKNYTSATNASDSLTVTKNSAVTLQLTLGEYKSADYFEADLFKFADALPSGAKILLINTENNTYYEYTATSNMFGLSDIPTDLFGNNCSYSDGTLTLLLIIDFDDAELTVGSYPITVFKTPHGLDNSDVATFTVTTANETAFGISGSNGSYSVSTSTPSGATDSYYAGRGAAMVLTKTDGTAFPAGSYASYNGNIYTPIRKNNDSGMQIIVPIGDANAKTVAVSVYSPVIALSEVKAELYISGSDNGSCPFGTDLVATLNNAGIDIVPVKDIEVTFSDSYGDPEDHILAQSNPDDEQYNISLQTASSSVLDDCTLIVEEKQADGTYRDVTGDKIELDSSKTVYIKTDTPDGTYRIKLTYKGSIDYYYYFIVYTPSE